MFGVIYYIYITVLIRTCAIQLVVQGTVGTPVVQPEHVVDRFGGKRQIVKLLSLFRQVLFCSKQADFVTSALVWQIFSL